MNTPNDGLNFAIREGGSIRYDKKYGEYKPIAWLDQYLNVGALVLPSAVREHVGLDGSFARQGRQCHKMSVSTV